MTPEQMRERAAQLCDKEATFQEHMANQENISLYVKGHHKAVAAINRNRARDIRAIPIGPTSPDPSAKALKRALGALIRLASLVPFPCEEPLDVVHPQILARVVYAKAAIVEIRKITGD